MKGQLQQSPPFWLTKGFLHPRDRARHSHIKAQEHTFYPVLGGLRPILRKSLAFLDSKEGHGIFLPGDGRAGGMVVRRRAVPQRAALRQGKALSQLCTPTGSGKQALHWQAWQGQKAQTLRPDTLPTPSQGWTPSRQEPYYLCSSCCWKVLP